MTTVHTSYLSSHSHHIPTFPRSQQSRHTDTHTDHRDSPSSHRPSPSTPTYMRPGISGGGGSGLGGPYHHHPTGPGVGSASSSRGRSPLSMLRLLDVALEIGRGLGLVRSTSFLEELEAFVYRYASMGLAGLLKVHRRECVCKSVCERVSTVLCVRDVCGYWR